MSRGLFVCVFICFVYHGRPAYAKNILLWRSGHENISTVTLRRLINKEEQLLAKIMAEESALSNG